MRNKHFINRLFGKTNKWFEIDILLIRLFTLFTSFLRNPMNQGLKFNLLGLLSIQKRLNSLDLAKGTYINQEFIFKRFTFYHRYINYGVA